MNFNDAKNELIKNMEADFPGLHIEFSADSDDDGIVYVRVYGVADEDVNDSKRIVWDAIDALKDVEGVEFVPSVISMTNTKLCHPGLLPVPDVDDFDDKVSDGIMQLLEEAAALYCPRPVRFNPCIEGWGAVGDFALFHNIDEVTDERSFKIAA